MIERRREVVKGKSRGFTAGSRCNNIPSPAQIETGGVGVLTGVVFMRVDDRSYSSTRERVIRVVMYSSRLNASDCSAARVAL